jgi:hypothetical protein
MLITWEVQYEDKGLELGGFAAHDQCPRSILRIAQRDRMVLTSVWRTKVESMSIRLSTHLSTFSCDNLL